ncbi:MAG: UDP-glucose 4-epimerase GalE [Eubacteriales bacterium]|nr:UDP-glucose 4-epimerase GalE [Eubacteriales bacterium]
MNILVTGGAGYIASHTLIELLAAGHQPIVADNFSNSDSAVVGRVEKVAGVNIPCYEIDVTDYDALDGLMAEGNIDGIIHFAGYKAVGESVEKPLMYYRNNLGATLTVLECMKNHGVKKIIFSSSATVYGEHNQVPFVENMPTSCTNPYGWTKLMSEQIIQDAVASDPELSAVILRYFNPVGAHSSGMIGENPKGIPNNLMPYIQQVAIGARDKLTVFGDDYETIDGTGVRDYIHVSDLAKGHVAALDYSAEHRGYEVFNLGTGRGTSVLELVKTFASVNGVDVTCSIGPRRAGDIAECYADVSKANSILGWKAALGVEDMCRDAWRWEQNKSTM